MTQPHDNPRSRRDFLKTSAVAAVGTGVLTQLNGLAAGAFAAGDETIRIGLVGCGGRGTGAAREALNTQQSQGPVKLVAMGDAFADHLERSLQNIRNAVGDKADEWVAVPPENRFVGFDAYQRVIDSGVDLVILATPPGFRPIHFEAAVKAGKHVFMEKPVATDAPGVRQVLKAVEEAKKKNLKVGVGLQRHHEAKYLETIQRLHDGAIGDIVALRVYWNNPGVWEPRVSREQARSEMEYQMRNWYYYNWLCGDHIVEQHIHNIDVGCWAKGFKYPVEANGMGGRQVRTAPRYGEIYDHHCVEFTFDDGTKMFSQCRHQPGCWNSVSEYAHGTKGTADISGGRITDANGNTWRFNEKNPYPYQVEHDDLFRAIRENTPYNEGEYGAKSTMAAIFGRMATYSGKIVRWDDAINSPLSIMPETYAWDAQPPTLPNQNGEYPIPTPGVTTVL